MIFIELIYSFLRKMTFVAEVKITKLHSDFEKNEGFVSFFTFNFIFFDFSF